MVKQESFKEKWKSNVWLRLTFGLGFILLLLLIYSYQVQQTEDSMIQISEGLSISESDMASFIDVFQGQSFKLCVIATGECYIARADLGS